MKFETKFNITLAVMVTIMFFLLCAVGYCVFITLNHA